MTPAANRWSAAPSCGVPYWDTGAPGLHELGDYLDRPAPGPAQFGLPTEDDSSRDDALLSRNLRIPPFEPDLDALRSSTVRIVPAIGAMGEGTLARRGGEALAKKLGREPVVFPGDHGGFTKSPMSPDNDPAAFAAKLREVLGQT